MASFASIGPSTYWYLTRGTGTIALVLLTLSVALGVANSRRLRTPSIPRFVFDALHRSVSLLAVAFVFVHIVTSLLDSFAPIRLIDAVIPFLSPYRPLWLGLGTVAFDLLLAVAITSVLRQRFGYQAWRATHWAAYASWPVALLHGLGTGSDVKRGWLLAIMAGCLVIVAAAVVSRATDGWPRHQGARLTALGASALLPLGLLVWLPSGPLGSDWSRRAGTPAALLGAPPVRSASMSPRSAGAAGAGSAAGGTSSGFRAQVSGTIQQVPASQGLAAVNISLAASGQRLSRLSVHLQGQPLQGGGLQMTSSSVTLGTASNPVVYRGTVSSLEGTNIEAGVQDPGGHVLRLALVLQLGENGTVTGTVTATP